VAEAPANPTRLARRRPSDDRVISMVGAIDRCYARGAMRALLTVLLAFVVVFQSSWALAAPYCQHERTVASAHFGHHEHQHEAISVAASGDTADASAAQTPDGVDVDCSACHASSPAIVLPIIHALTDPRQSERIARVPTASPAASSACIERPNWPALA